MVARLMRTGCLNLLKPRKKFIPEAASFPAPKDLSRSDYEAVFLGSEWSKKMMEAVPNYEIDAIKNEGYLHVSAKDVLMLILEPLCTTVHPWIFPHGLSPSIIKPVAVFDKPIITCKLLPFDPDVLYIFVDASVIKIQGSFRTGISYVMLRYPDVIDEAIFRKTNEESNPYVAEVHAINFGTRAGLKYLATQGQTDLPKLKGVCLCSDSDTGLAHSLGSSVIRKPNPKAELILRDTQEMMGMYDVFHFHLIRRELNVAADYLASYAAGHGRESSPILHNQETYNEICEPMLNRDPRVGYGVGKSHPVVF